MRRYVWIAVVLGLLSIALSAQDHKKYSVRTLYGWATTKDLGEVLVGNVSPDSQDYKVYSLDGGYLLWSDVNEWPLDIYAKGGLNYYDEGRFDDAYGMDIYIKALWNFDFWDNRVRFGVGEGLSYTSRTLEIEKIDAIEKDSPTSQFLNYLDFSLDFDLGKLVRSKTLDELYLGVAIKHRSGVFGLFNGVHGGSNYNAFYVEKNF